MIKIFYTFLEKPLHNDAFAKYLSSMPPGIGDAVLRYRNPLDRDRVLFGKMLLREALKCFSGTDLSLNVLKCSEYGRPYFESGVDFNISHSGNCVLCAISDACRVGIDVEQVKPIDLADFRSQWTTREWKHLMESEDKYREFYRLWTRKEAVIKADGKGLQIPLIQLEVIDDRVQLASDTWFLTEIKLCNSSIAHLATSLRVDAESIAMEERYF